MTTILVYNANLWPLDGSGPVREGYLLAKEGVIRETGSGLPPHKDADTVIDAHGMAVMPGLVDCHTHLMEYATPEIHQARGKAQRMAGVANLLTALKAGITMVGEQHLGHPFLSQNMSEYKAAVEGLPLDVRFSYGSCIIGTEPWTVVAATKPAQVVDKDDLTEADYNSMAEASDYPGENIFLNTTVANLPLEIVPRAGEITFSSRELENIVQVFHKAGKKIGAHLEGDQAARMFIEAGGDVIHHGHKVNPTLGALMAAKGVALVITPHAGTCSRPTSPEEAYEFYRAGVKIALASDSYIPVHPAASWIDLPAGFLAGPAEFLTVCRPILHYFREQGTDMEEVLKLITVNGREIMGAPGRGTLTPGETADFLIAQRIPGVETTDIADIKYVVKNGEVVIAR